jgi:hypothetical protein
MSPSPPILPSKIGRQQASTCENACDEKQPTRVGRFPGLMGGSASKGSF